MMDFISFDFETASGKHPCSLGLAKFIDGKLVDKRYYLINPDIESWNVVAMRIHGIKPSDVINAPKFIDIQEDIFEFIGSEVLVAHNCSFDYSVLEFATSNTLAEKGNKFYCTLNYSKSSLDLDSYKLNRIISELKLSNFKHHNALDDAIACGELFNYLINKSPSLLENSRYTKTVSNHGSRNFYVNGVTIFDFEDIIDLDHEEKQSLLNRKSSVLKDFKIIASGTFKNFSRSEINELIINNGARKVTSISSKTDYVIAGQNMGPTKFKKADDLDVKIISEQEFLEML